MQLYHRARLGAASSPGWPRGKTPNSMWMQHRTRITTLDQGSAHSTAKDIAMHFNSGCGNREKKALSTKQNKQTKKHNLVLCMGNMKWKQPPRLYLEHLSEPFRVPLFLGTCPCLTASRGSRNLSRHSSGSSTFPMVLESTCRAQSLRVRPEHLPQSDLKPWAHPAKPRAWFGNTLPGAAWWEKWRPGISIVWPCNAQGLRLWLKSCWSRQLLKKEKGKKKPQPTKPLSVQIAN